ncbi:MAG: methyltransferase domain-containing protein [Magnetococcales bacterium]|nr:methyltransferase domain-containing protein [Magnetococcales bacterium]MBF0321637.1 methyltransferase domain-containing protein [Magnetococcales bacterium]
MNPEKFAKILRVCVCPGCKGDLIQQGESTQQDSALVCPSCHATYPVKNGAIHFITPIQTQDSLDGMKYHFKRLLGPLYYRLVRPAISPSYPYDTLGYLLKSCRPGEEIVLDLGSGNHRIHPDVFAIDVVDYAAVDIVCSIHQLPFRSHSVTMVLTNNVMEHIPYIHHAWEEIQRITKPNGENIHVVPFLYPFHASPDDFQRYTHAGLAHLFSGWQVLQQITVAGPFSLFNAAVTEFFSILLSFGQPKLQGLLYLLLCVPLAPLKFLDFLFVGHARFISMAAIILIHLRKPPSTDHEETPVATTGGLDG